ncbi:UV DNA damage repair endonuclease UvsE [Erysipelothrix aquatica]|uniref:UV DNA damage repair endonuclease UvsE n=1 Tax=Erysipelothrix aquatica TaxID=2683714 RepID=UPI00135B8E98|nr:UV DNA damage repair endonuclease UvsE [Erysipelothrix aquatica]
MSITPRIGYASLNIDTHARFRTCRKDDLTETLLRDLIRDNLATLDAMLDYNIKHNNYFFRISSSLIPFGSSPLNTLNWSHEFSEYFTKLRTKIQTHQIRISCHPGQYTVLNAQNEAVVAASIDDLRYHAQLMELLSGDANHKIILHVGGVYGDKEAAMRRFINVYNHRLPEIIKKYLVIENDDRLYTVADILYLSEKTEVPLIYDNLHHLVNPSLETLAPQEIVAQVIGTWKEDDGRPKVHYSQQAYNKRPGAHTDTINLDQFIDDYELLYSQFDLDIMLEVKDKNRSFIKVNQYFNPSQLVLEQEWARYKYLIMSYSTHAYNELRLLFRENKIVNPVAFYHVVDQTLAGPTTIGTQINALEHAWGYFKHHASSAEQKRFFSYLEALRAETVTIQPITKFLYKLAMKYQSSYLLESYFLVSSNT